MYKVILLPLMLLTSCSYLNMRAGIDDDHIGEELAEEVIQMKTGLDLDLTPSTPEYNTRTLSPAPPMPPFREGFQ